MEQEKEHICQDFGWAAKRPLQRSCHAAVISIFPLLLGLHRQTNPQVMAIVLIEDPVGIYYGGTIAAPIVL